MKKMFYRLLTKFFLEILQKFEDFLHYPETRWAAKISHLYLFIYQVKSVKFIRLENI